LFDVKEVITMAEIISTIAGKIKEINISVGQPVTEDDEAFIIEAMKMENVVYGEDGSVKEIFVNVGDLVQEGDKLAIVE
jgi:biotin carboxyl carrier protein